MQPTHTTASLIAIHTRRQPDAVAISAPGRPGLTYGGLGALFKRVAAELGGFGVKRDRRVALALPAGPEAAVATLAVMHCATCLPLNPASREPEFEASLRRMRADFLVVPAGGGSEAAAAAATLGIPLIQLDPRLDGPAGEFYICGAGRKAAPEPPGPDEVAVVMQTSGTTARPKVVPLTHAMICASALQSLASMALVPQDRFLSVVSTQHIAGVSLMLASLAGGINVFCAPGFYRARYFDWMEEFRPTWLWAAPTMLADLLPKARANRALIERCPQRFIRVGAAALPAALQAEAEEVFRAPVVANYGMTEAGPLITTNPLPPGKRKPGSSGLPAGTEVLIDSVGEILVRGPNVMRGYEDDPAANGDAFVDGWFRTGDLGFLDEEGYLFVTGRVKELINRGGQKVSPREVESVLMSHPSVAEAVAFAMPHERLSEEVAAAVVPRDGAALTEADLRAFAALRLADFKVPAQVAVLAEIPKGPYGKVQRTGLAKQLGLRAHRADAGPEPSVAGATPVEKALAEIWSRILRVENVGVHDDFFQLGGDSFALSLVVTEIEERFGIDSRRLGLVDLDNLTIAAQARSIAETQQAEPEALRPVVPIRRSGKNPPFFCVAAVAEDVYYLRHLARRLGDSQPFYALRDPARLDERGVYSIEALAAKLVRAVRALQPCGPYLLGGHCFGGIVAFEMAQQLLAQDAEVALLALFDTPAPNDPSPWRHWKLYARKLRHLAEAFRRTGSTRSIVQRHVGNRFHRWLFRLGFTGLLPDALDIPSANRRAARLYVPKVYPGRVAQFAALGKHQGIAALDTRLTWREVAGGGFDLYPVQGAHDTMFDEPFVTALAAHLSNLIR